MADTDVAALYRRASDRFTTLVAGVGPDQWDGPTPCSAWNVRALVQHVVVEDLWTPPLLHGETIAQVGDRFDGDMLGDDPATSARQAARSAVDAVNEPGALERTTHLSFGDVPGEEYVWQLFTDHLIHGWDLARATGQDDRLDADLVTATSEWFANYEDMMRHAGLIGPRVTVTDDDPQVLLLASLGRSAEWSDPEGTDR